MPLSRRPHPWLDDHKPLSRRPHALAGRPHLCLGDHTLWLSPSGLEDFFWAAPGCIVPFLLVRGPPGRLPSFCGAGWHHRAFSQLELLLRGGVAPPRGLDGGASIAEPFPYLHPPEEKMATRKSRPLELLSGTGGVGNVACRLGWDVVSLDVQGSPTICADILEWDFKAAHEIPFDWVQASPPRAEYSMAKTCRIRDIVGANAISRQARGVIEWQKRNRSGMAFTIENPPTSLLRDQQAVSGLRWVDTNYCCQGYPYRKSTCIWSNVPLGLPRCGVTHCQYGGMHPSGVQEAPPGMRMRIPPSFCFELAYAALLFIGCASGPRVPLGISRPPTSGGPPRTCIACGGQKSGRWYKGPRCRLCYRKGRAPPAQGRSNGPATTV